MFRNLVDSGSRNPDNSRIHNFLYKRRAVFDCFQSTFGFGINQQENTHS